MNAVLSHPGAGLRKSRSIPRRASIRFLRASRSRTSRMRSRRIWLQLMPSRRSMRVFSSSSTRTVTSGTDCYTVCTVYLLSRENGDPTPTEPRPPPVSGFHHDVGPHHLVVLVVEDVAVPHVPRPGRRVERVRRGPVDRREAHADDRDLPGVHPDRVLPALLVRARRPGEAGQARRLEGGAGGEGGAGPRPGSGMSPPPPPPPGGGRREFPRLVCPPAEIAPALG